MAPALSFSSCLLLLFSFLFGFSLLLIYSFVFLPPQFVFVFLLAPCFRNLLRFLICVNVCRLCFEFLWNFEMVLCLIIFLLSCLCLVFEGLSCLIPLGLFLKFLLNLLKYSRLFFDLKDLRNHLLSLVTYFLSFLS